MKESALGRREKIFAICCLGIINILCIVKAIITLVNHNNFLNLIETELTLSNHYQLMLVLTLILVIMSVICFISSYICLAIRNRTAQKSIFIILITIALLSIIFFFVMRFMIKDYYSLNVIKNEYEEFVLYNYKYDIIINTLYLIASLGLSLINNVICINLAIDIYNNSNKDENSADALSEDEQSIQDEIKNLKNKIRIKNLESEYLNLRAQLDEDNAKTKN